jgi:uncharacterized phage protein (TIGR01671 family)
MREHKFRRWDKNNKRFAYMELFNKGTYQITDFPDGGEGLGDYEQFTGLYDKHKKPIFEGDILHWHNEWLDDPEIEDDGILQVVFEMGYWLLKKISGNDLGRWGLWKNIDDQDTEGDISFEIIGNIHQNPELIKGAS